MMGSCSDKIDFSAFLCFCLKFGTFLVSKLIVDIVRFWGHICTSLITRDLKTEVGHFTANDKLRFGVNGFTLPFYPYLGLTSILDEILSSKLRFLK